MAQTKRKRRTKHRGNAAGVVTSRGRTSPPPKGQEAKDRQKAQAREKRAARYDKPPSWRSSIQRAAITCALLFVVLMIIPGPKHNVAATLLLTAIAFAFYVPMGYMIDNSLYRRRQKRKADQGK
jgi:Flp pilus assembly protein TadB